MGKVIVVGLVAFIGYWFTNFMYESAHSKQVKTFGVATSYPSCDDHSCRVAVRWANGKESVEQIRSNYSQPVLGEVMTRTCTHYETYSTSCEIRPTGQVAPNH